MPQYFALNYSKKQHDICLKHDKNFKCNTYKGEQYSEMKTGQTEKECISCFDDARIVLSGKMELMHETEKHIAYYG